MPELAEVEYFRKQWDGGIGFEIASVKLHEGKRIFRATRLHDLLRLLPGSVLLRSEARGKQLLFQFSRDLWLGLHLGMTGCLSAAPPDFKPSSHDHLVLYQKGRALVFADSRQFGRVQFTQAPGTPEWWAKLPAAITSSSFSRMVMEAFLARHRKLPIKAALLLQAGFPGIGNWMADEILWRAHIHPLTRSGIIRGPRSAALWKSLGFVCRGALRYIGDDFSDPPSRWLFHERWSRDGRCPIHHEPLQRQTIGGRTTVWCFRCQPVGRSSRC
jgi:formamidopyrimidine-DNA glycosylase